METKATWSVPRPPGGPKGSKEQCPHSLPLPRTGQWETCVMVTGQQGWLSTCIVPGTPGQVPRSMPVAPPTLQPDGDSRPER